MENEPLLTPETIVKSLESGLLAERAKLHLAEKTVREAKERIRKAEKLLKSIRRTFNLKEPEPLVAKVPTSPKPGGIAIVDENNRIVCGIDGCTFAASTMPALGSHRYFKHGMGKR